jgi:regulator of replication initiation timing
MRDKIRVLTTQLAELKRREHREITDLRATVSTLAQHVQALTLENQALRTALEKDAGVTRISDRDREPKSPGDHEKPASHPRRSQQNMGQLALGSTTTGKEDS